VATKLWIVVAALLAIAACKRSHDHGSDDGRSGVPEIKVNVQNESAAIACPDDTSRRYGGLLEWCERDDGTRHGPSVARLPCNRVPTRHETYRDGELEGDVIDWYVGVHASDRFVSQPGICDLLAENPQAAADLVRIRAGVTPYSRGKAHGMHTEWSAAGKKTLEGPYRDGVPHGTWRSWSATGKHLGSYEMDEGTGIETRWHDDGARAQEWHRQSGNRHGRFRRWHGNGELAQEGMFIDGLADGTWKQWSPDGVLLGTYGMKAGTGVERTWNDDGSVKAEVPMKDGEPLPPTR
jgi:antitoxin component YwqK of YwqJK toxin-antitoxin module